MPDDIQRPAMSGPTIYIDGNHHLRLNEDLLQLEVEETLSAAACCRVEFINFSGGTDGRPDYICFDLNDFDYGKDLSIFVGVSTSDAVITNSIVAASYTAGAGNIW